MPNANTDLQAHRYDLLSRVADDLAHEIKNPLHAMIINLEVLRRRADAGNAEAVRDRADVIEHEIHRVHRLIDMLLQLARPGRFEDDAPLMLADALQDVVPLIELQARLARIPFVYQPPSEALAVQLSRDAIKFAFLAVAEALLDAGRSREAPEASGGLRISASHDERVARIEIGLASTVADPASLETASLFLGSSGRIEPAPDGATVVVVLPRVTSA